MRAHRHTGWEALHTGELAKMYMLSILVLELKDVYKFPNTLSIVKLRKSEICLRVIECDKTCEFKDKSYLIFLRFIHNTILRYFKINLISKKNEKKYTRMWRAMRCGHQ